MVIPPFTKPDAPNPAIARPPISIDDEMATPHIRDPSSKTKAKTRNVYYQDISFAQSEAVKGWQLHTFTRK